MKGVRLWAVSKRSKSGWIEQGRTECALFKPLIKIVLWAYAVRPYTHLLDLAPKERQSLAQGVPPWDSLLCVFVSLWCRRASQPTLPRTGS
jgi:hypothetical protein